MSFFYTIFLFLFFGLQFIYSQDAGSNKPNILLIVADDMGYADLGCFGSAILTPNIDQLAGEGIRFTNFYSAPSCAPTRASLLTGADNHMAGVGSQFYRAEDQWGYEGFLSDRVVTIPQVLGTNGYQNYMVGKWHLGGEKDQLPHQKGFHKSFIMYQGAGNHFNNVGFEAADLPSTYALNGKIVNWPTDGYSTDLYTEYLLDFIGTDKNNNQPFFAFAAYTSPHWPLQVDSSYWKKYETKFADGYEALRKRNLEALKDKGIISKTHPLPPIHPNITPWDSLSAKQQKIETRKMALYAGMLENLDYNVGRLIKRLKDNGQYQNTIIVFMSDNGAAYRDFYESGPFKEFIQANYDNSYENMGKASSFVSYGYPWAEAGSAPFRYVKQYTFEGGIRVPLIIKVPNENKSGSINHSFLTLTDLAPTFYDISASSYPKVYKNKDIFPLSGKSLKPLLEDSTTEIHTKDEAWTMEHHHHALVRKGPWKLVNPGMMWDESKFELYNIINDPSESINLKIKQPAIYNELLQVWQNYRAQYKIIKYN